MLVVVKNLNTMRHSIKINRSGRFIMELLQHFWRTFMRFAKGASWCAMPFFLFACAATPAQQTAVSADVANSATAKEAKQATEKPMIPLTGELVYTF